MLQFLEPGRKLSPLPRRSPRPAVAPCSNGSYPVLTLPFEITAKIFIQCIVETAEPDPSSAPLLLGRICRQWRSVALSSPSLWSCFNKTLEIDKSLDVHPSRYSSLLELLQIYLSRSGTHPLKLTLRYNGIRIRPTPDPIHRVLLQHAHRWQDVRLCLPYADLVQLFEQFTGSFPSLQTLSIGMPYHLEFTPSLSFAPLRISQLLQTFSVCGDFLRPLTSSVPWSHLIRFDGHGLTLLEAYEILRLCPSLQECTLDIATKLPNQPIAPSVPLRLVDLRTLHLSGLVDFGLLMYLTLPALQQLDLRLDVNDIPHFYDFLSRSSCPLAELRFSAMGVDESSFGHLFAFLPHLVKLDLGLMLGPPNALAEVLHSKERYLPQLANLTISAGSEVDYERFADMLESRSGIDNSQGVVQLQVFKLRHLLPFPTPTRSARAPDSGTVERLKMLVKGGMDISMPSDSDW
ncbi:hypothetical protein C8R44DRAFT_159642 [Mycena epipterygia]|nr:hypothetical protein C8R44DRAFT_159642 [Mycena epipterygia]